MYVCPFPPFVCDPAMPLFPIPTWPFCMQLSNVDSVRKQLEVQTNDLRQTIEDKLRSAEENRTENLGKMLEKLKEHVSVGGLGGAGKSGGGDDDGGCVQIIYHNSV